MRRVFLTEEQIRYMASHLNEAQNAVNIAVDLKNGEDVNTAVKKAKTDADMSAPGVDKNFVIQGSELNEEENECNDYVCTKRDIKKKKLENLKKECKTYTKAQIKEEAVRKS